jgi:4-amino-4-deoxychorismate lyase
MDPMATEVLIMLNQPSQDAAAHDPAAPPFTVVDPHTPQISALDLGINRGDGIFESVSVGYGRPQALEHHLRRFARSAAALELPAPDLEVWRDVVLAAIAELDDAGEAWVKTVLTRGVEGDGRPTGFAYAAPAPDFTASRRDGIAVVMLDRGYRHDIERTSPWLLGGAKTLSYAVNLAAKREAVRRGAEDVIFVSSDGFVLEGPNSSVVYRVGDRILTPGTGLGILDGTTQANVFRFAEAHGLETDFHLATPDEVRQADALWLVSSVRLAVPVRELDGAPFPMDAAFTAAMNEHLRAIEE